MLIEVERKGLGSTFAFFCSNTNCNDQTSFYSSDVAIAGNNLTVHCMNHRTNLAMRSIGCDRPLRAWRTLKGRKATLIPWGTDCQKKGQAAPEWSVGGVGGAGLPGWRVLELLSVERSISVDFGGWKSCRKSHYFDSLTRYLKHISDIFVKFCTQFQTTNIWVLSQSFLSRWEGSDIFKIFRNKIYTFFIICDNVNEKVDVIFLISYDKIRILDTTAFIPKIKTIQVFLCCLWDQGKIGYFQLWGKRLLYNNWYI